MPEVLSLDEACHFLKLSKQSLYAYVRKGEVPAYKLGRCWKFHKESLDQWLKDKIKEDTKTRNKKNKS